MKFEVIAMSQTTLDYKDDSLMFTGNVMPYGMRDKMSHNYLSCSCQERCLRSCLTFYLKKKKSVRQVYKI